MSAEMVEHLRGRCIEAMTPGGTYFNDPVEPVLLEVLASHERLRAKEGQHARLFAQEAEACADAVRALREKR
jgi:hypothetical protein